MYGWQIGERVWELGCMAAWCKEGVEIDSYTLGDKERSKALGARIKSL
jgi:hypothetical protein